MPRSFGRRALLRWTGAATLAAVATPIVAACASAPPTAAPTAVGSAASGAAATKPATGGTPQAAAPATGGATSQLRLNIRSGPYNDAWAKVGDLFKQKFPSVELKWEPFPASELTQKLETMAAGNTIGDLYFINTFQMDHQRFGALGIAKALDDYAKKDAIDWSQWFKVAVDQLYANGKLYGMLDGASPGRAGLYYSVEMFQEAGIPEPDESWTLDKLAEVGQKLSKDGKFGFRPLAGSAPELLIWVRAFGGDIYSKDGKKATVNTPEAKAGLTWIYDGMYKTKFMPLPDQAKDGFSTLFAAKKLAMHNSGTWDANASNATKVKWNIVPLPKGPTGIRGSMAEANTICVTSQSKNPDMAWEFAKLDASKEGGIFHLDLGVTPGGRPDVYNDSKVQEKYFWMKQWAKIWEGALPFNGPANYRGSEASDTMQQGFDALWIGQAKPDGDIFDKVNAAVQKVLDKPA
ncbi:MAG TPA: sugar ABC transporter substrate-binding protein [Chloroflexota bacterium]|nr:sugar ABC transporter substrate-binding protein [Chloroflexota bacterium]